MSKNIIDKIVKIGIEIANAAAEDAKDYVNRLARQNKLSPARAEKFAKDFLKHTKGVQKQIAAMAKTNVSGRIRNARGILRALDKSMGWLERNLRKIK